jgi:hypothetical protein
LLLDCEELSADRFDVDELFDFSFGLFASLLADDAIEFVDVVDVEVFSCLDGSLDGTVDDEDDGSFERDPRAM